MSTEVIIAAIISISIIIVVVLWGALLIFASFTFNSTGCLFNWQQHSSAAVTSMHAATHDYSFTLILSNIYTTVVQIHMWTQVQKGWSHQRASYLQLYW